jgi:ubiquinone/menaquinone biosynthesis C-methylase UbiE/uncharacterized protein YbaR (Trm112 family)
MKHRLVDLLQCQCGKSGLLVRTTKQKRVPFSMHLSETRCRTNCSFRQRPANQVSAKDCEECYALEIVEGAISCACGQEWTIVRGVPRLLPAKLVPELRKTQSTFSFEWKHFRFGERNWGQTIDYRKTLFLKAFGVEATELKSKLILDAGCGSGLLSIEMAESFGLEVVALDLAFGVEQAYERNTNPFVHFLQGSVLELPFRDRVFDFVYCAGVLVHCPNARDGLASIMRALKHGGRCFIWLYHPVNQIYHPDDWRKNAAYDWIRHNVTSRLPINVQNLLYLSLMPPFILKQWFRRLLGHTSEQRTWREKMQNLFDMFSPIYRHTHTPQEAIEWLYQEGCADAQVSYREEYGFGVRGDLKASPQRSST